MKLRHRWTGDVDMMRTYRSLSGAVSRQVMTDALREAAEPLRAAAAAAAPRSKGAGPHLADSIVVAETQFAGNGNAAGPDVVTVAIGPSHKPVDMFYGFFQEFGTAHHASQPFMRPAWMAEHRQLPKLVSRAIWVALTGRLRKGSR